MDGPIPGENFTSNTKNYPWHRPPDMADYVEIVNKAVNNLLDDPEKTSFALTALETGESILDFVTGTLRVAVGGGKIPIDMAVLSAGPIAKAMETLAEMAEIKYDRGWKQEPNIVTPQRVRAITGMDTSEEVEKTAPIPEEEMTGIMARGNGPAPKEVQSEMLGQTGDDEDMQ